MTEREFDDLKFQMVFTHLKYAFEMLKVQTTMAGIWIRESLFLIPMSIQSFDLI